MGLSHSVRFLRESAWHVLIFGWVLVGLSGCGGGGGGSSGNPTEPASANPAPQPGEIILDDGDPGTSAQGNWSPSSAENPWDGDSVYARDSGAYVYDVTLGNAGTYGVYVWFTNWPSRESAVPYEVQHAKGTAVVYLDQRINGGQWSSLGNYPLGDQARITVKVVDSNTVCADAIRLVPGGGAPPPNQTSPPDPVDTEPDVSPEITELAAFPLTPNMARVSWETSFLGDSRVEYGTSTSLGSSRSVSGSRAYHSVLLKGLSSDRTYYVRARSSGGGQNRSSAVVSFRTPDASPGFSVTDSHPRVFFNKSDISKIRSRIQNEPIRSWWGSLENFASQQADKSVSSIIDEYPTYNAALAFAGLIGDRSGYRDKAIAVAMKVASLSSPGDDKEVRRRVDFIIPAYDWLHDYLSSSEKSTLRSELATLAYMLESQVYTQEYANGHSNGNQNGALLAALAIYGEHSDASGIVSRALRRYNEGFWPFWRHHGSENGGSFKSAWYTTVANHFNLEAMAAWESATGQNLFAKEKSWFEGLGDWYLYSARGDKSWVRHGDVVYQQGWDELERYILLQVANQFQDRTAQWLSNRIRDHLSAWGPHNLPDILWYNPSVSPSYPKKPLSRHFKGTGMVFMLESWADRSVRANFRAIPHYIMGHSHLDQCSFSIYYRGGLALDSGVYDDYSSSHWLNYYSRTIAHNSILVEDPSESFEFYGTRYVSDGGQNWLQPSQVPDPFPENIGDLTNTDAYDLGGIFAYEDTDLYTYSVGDGTPAYSPRKLRVFVRHFLWLKSLSGWNHPVVLVFDQVESTSSSYRKTYLLHTENKPSVSGNMVTATNGNGKLYQRTVYPTDEEITLIGGSGKEYWVDGRNYPPNRPPKSGEEAGAWRVEVSPSGSRTRDEFLHVLYPTDSGAGSPPSVSRIDAGSMKGLETRNLVILFAERIDSVSSASYSLSASRRNLLFGLEPGRSFEILVDGKKAATLRSSVNGTLDFTNSAGGEIELVAK